LSDWQNDWLSDWLTNNSMGHSLSSEANSSLATQQIPEIYETIITVFTNSSSPAPTLSHVSLVHAPTHFFNAHF
jgi:hypothetical protein